MSEPALVWLSGHEHLCLDRFGDAAHIWVCSDADCQLADRYDATILRCEDHWKAGHR